MLGSIISSIVWFGIIKCPIHINKACYDYLFYLSVLDMCLSPHVVQKSLYRKISVGETHRDLGLKFDQENHKIWKVINQGPRTTKRAPSSCSSRLPGHPIGLASP
jgi:hypothetical protein